MKDAITLINELPGIQKLRVVCQALALSDAILMTDWEHRYFSFNSNWDVAGKEMMSSMRDGSGGEYFIHFSEYGAIGKVLCKEQVENSLSILNSIPECFNSFKTEAAFSLEYVTYCFWRQADDKEWTSFPANLPEFALLKFLAEGCQYYHDWAESYYERSIDRKIFQKVFETLNVTNEDLMALNPDITLEDLSDDLEEILGNSIL